MNPAPLFVNLNTLAARTPKTAIVHDWLTGMRGGEKVLEAIASLYPEADLYTLICDRHRISDELRRRKIHTSPLQSLPAVFRYYRYLLPLMPRAIETFDLSGCGMVISSSHCVAKGVGLGRGGKRPLHICYCHTPMRYVYHQFDNYFPGQSRGWVKRGADLFLPSLMRWDKRSAKQVDHFIANSENVRRRIQAIYDRDAAVIYPPVDTDFFRTDSAVKAGDYFLVAGALVPYKRVDIAIQACRSVGVPLKIVGIGNDEKRLRALAQGANVEFLGWQTGEALRRLYQGCQALLFPQEEDFGITAVEAMACGRPVIAYGRGGALETVQDGKTGLHFGEQTAESLAAALDRFDPAAFEPAALRTRAEGFDRQVFVRKFSDFIESACANAAARVN